MQEDKKSLHERIDEQNNNRSSQNNGDSSNLNTEQRPAETHNAVSGPNGDAAGENKVWTSLDDE